jgi:hypothetical protein
MMARIPAAADPLLRSLCAGACLLVAPLANAGAIDKLHQFLESTAPCAPISRKPSSPGTGGRGRSRAA